MISLPLKKIKLDSVDGYRLVKSAVVRSSKGEKVFLSTNIIQNDAGQRCLSTDIFDANRNHVGYNTFNINPASRNFNGYFIEVAENSQKHGYGEIMRLASVIDLLENNLSSIQIFSTNDAIMFHYKYGFKPQVNKYDEACDILHNICKEKSPELKNVSENAGEVLDCLLNGGMWFGQGINFIKKSAEVVEEYLSTVKEKHLKWISDKFSHGVNFRKDIDMKLDIDTVRQNRDFFNQLFEKHDFDYRI